MANTKTTHPKLNFLIALFPGFQLLDVAGPLDIFNFLSQPPYSAPITMKFIAEHPGSVGTKIVDLPDEERWEYDVQSAMGLKDREGVNRRWNQRFVVDGTFEEILVGVEGGQGAGEGEGWDVLFIPGGVGSRVRRKDRRTGDTELAIQPLINFVKKIRPHLKLGIITVCTGSDILGYTGLLDGRRATTNMSRFLDVSGRHKEVQWQKGGRWVKSGETEDRQHEKDGKGKGIEIWTSAGVSAGMDVALAFVAEKFGGIEVAKDIAKKSEYDWSMPGEGEICRFYGEYFGV